MLSNILREVKRTVDVSLSSLATQTAALGAGDLVDLVLRAKNAATKRSLSDFSDR
jgi:hypothetical protein